MSTTSSFKRNVLASWGTHVSNLVIGFFLTRYTLEVLGVSTYGTWLLINSIAGYGGLLYFGFGDTISRYVAKHHAEGNTQRLNEIVSLVLFVYLGMGGVAMVLACVLSATAHLWGGWTGTELLQARLTTLILGVNVAVSMAGSVFGGVLHGLRRFDLERGIGFTFDLVRAALFVLFLSAENGLVVIALIYFIVTVGENTAYLFVSRRVLPTLSIRREHLNWSVFRECGSFSTMAFGNAIASQLINYTDTIVIGLMLGKEAIVPYYFGLRVMQFAKQPIDKIATICMPTAGGMQSEGDKSRRDSFLIKALGVVLLLTGAAFIGAWFFAGDLLRLWVGTRLSAEDLSLSHRVLTILLGAELIALPCSVLRAFLVGSGRVAAPALIYLAEAVLNLVISVALARQFGVEGVAWGTAIPLVVIELGILIPYALRQLEISPYRVLREAVWPQLMPLLALLCFSQLMSMQTWSHDGWRMLFLVSATGGLVLGAAYWLNQRIRRAELSTA